MREQLIRYLLGELDEGERRNLQTQLKASPELQAELAHLRQCFASNQEDDDFGESPPRNLAERTADRVSHSDDNWGVAPQRPPSGFQAAGDAPAGILGWSLADLTVAGGVMLAVSMLLFPAISNSRYETRRNVCQRNLAQLGQFLALNAADHGNFFPQVLSDQTAGMYVVRLIERGYADPAELAPLLVCPGAPLADEIRSGRLKIYLPNAEVLRVMTADQQAKFAATASMFYNYRLPYRIGSDLYFIRDDHRKLSPVLSDASPAAGVELVSPNHGGPIVQVQFADGHCLTLTSCLLPASGDDLFRNKMGIVAAGLDRQDVVLAPSDARP